jgi:hypothetical protein
MSTTWPVKYALFYLRCLWNRFSPFLLKSLVLVLPFLTKVHLSFLAVFPCMIFNIFIGHRLALLQIPKRVLGVHLPDFGM